MNEQILLNAQCTICLETYKSPIRMLPCGHNFCESCLVDLHTTSQQQLSCPNCRETIRIESEGVSSLPRCHDLESLIEVLTRMDLSIPITVLSGDAITQLGERATLLINEEKYQEALELLQIVTTSGEISEIIFHLINKANCQIEIGLREEAIVTATEIASLVVSYTTTTTHVSDSMKKQIFDKLIALCKKFIDSNINDSVISLVNCLFSLTKTFYEAQIQLEMFVNIGDLVQNLVIKMLKNNYQNQIKNVYCLFDEIFDNMQKISDVDLKFKCQKIVLVLNSYSFCCNSGNDVSKSEIIHHKAISMMEFVFGSDAKKYVALGHCYYKLGNCYMKLNRFKDAKPCFLKASKVYEKATDMIDENERHTLISLSLINLQTIEDKSK